MCGKINKLLEILTQVYKEIIIITTTIVIWYLKKKHQLKNQNLKYKHNSLFKINSQTAILKIVQLIMKIMKLYKIMKMFSS